MKKALNNDHYTYRVIWSEEDEAHIGLCAEFPGISWIAATPEGALRGVRKEVANIIEDMEANAEPVPEPFSSRRFSGKFIVRVPPVVHRELAIEAAEAGVSINRLVSAKLAG